MENGSPGLIYRQFMRGLSGGIIALAIAGYFWSGLAAWAADCARTGTPPWVNGHIAIHHLRWEPWIALAITASIVYGAILVRRKASRFKYSEIRSASEVHRKLSRSILARFILIAAAQGALCGLTVYAALRFQRQDLIWPGIGLIVSLHFVPLGSIFRVRPYQIAGFIGAVFSSVTLLTPQALLNSSSDRWVIAGLGIGPTMWATAAYVILRADGLAAAWVDTSAIGGTYRR